LESHGTRKGISQAVFAGVYKRQAMTPYHVLHILGTAQADATGIARIVGAIAKGVDPVRFKVHAWFLTSDGPLVAELERSEVAVRIVPLRDGLRDPIGMWQFWRALREYKFAIVHQHVGGRAIRWVARASRGARILVHLHSRILEAQGSEPVNPNIQAADFVVATSRAVAERVKSKNVGVVYPGVTTNGSLSKKRACQAGNTKIVGTAGRLVPVKGIVHLIHAIHLLRSRIPDVRLEIAGSGPEEPALRRVVQQLGLNDRVTFLGWQTDLAPLFERWDVFAMPSIEEAFGIAALEAMAAGLPVVATNVGGVPELVEHGKTGWLVPPGDPVALSERLTALLVDPQQQRLMGAAGRRRAEEKFSQRRMVSEVEHIYEKLIAFR
jgi:glycosyltransferase involved in cell wall biosynthesis